MNISTLRVAPPFAELRQMAAAASTDDPGLREAVAGILRDVRARGDEALLEYTARFDGFQAPDAPGLRIGVDQLEEAARSIDPDLLGSLRAAASTTGVISPPGVGDAIAISSTPATAAGMAFMSTDDGYAARPPGT